MGRWLGSRDIERLLWVLCVVAAVLVTRVTVPRLETAKFRARLAETRAAQQKLRLGVLAYRLDHGRYPDAVPLMDFVSNADPDNPAFERLERMGGAALQTIDPGLGKGGAPGLTTPMAYIPHLIPDAYTAGPGARPLPFAYGQVPGGQKFKFILFSPGPDDDYDIQDVGALFNPAGSESTPLLRRVTHDETLGPFSNGDVVYVEK